MLLFFSSLTIGWVLTYLGPHQLLRNQRIAWRKGCPIICGCSNSKSHHSSCGFAAVNANPTTPENAGPVAACGNPWTLTGRPKRTCCPNILAAKPSKPGIWLAPPVRTICYPGSLSKPATFSRSLTSSKISSIRGRMLPISSDLLTLRRSCSQSPLLPSVSIISRSSMPVDMAPP